MSLYVMEKSWVNMIVFGLLAVINIGLDLALIPRYGIWGAFIPVAVVLMIGVAAFWIVVKRFRPDVGIPISFIARCYAAAVPAALLYFSAVRWTSLPALAVQMIAGVALLVCGYRWMRVIGREEKELIRRLPIPAKEYIIALF
jgi:O-antigen/teichoic acid export membrane protein